MYDDGDILLFALSGWKEVGWARFKTIVDEIYSKRRQREGLKDDQPAHYERLRAVRVLASLGHCDIGLVGDTLKVYAAPPALAALPSTGSSRAVLCGARSPEGVADLRVACTRAARGLVLTVKSQEDRSVHAPSRIEVEGESPAILASLSKALDIPYVLDPPAWTTSWLSGSVEEYLRSLEWSKLPELNWERENFDPKLLRFSSSFSESRGIRLSRYHDPVRLGWLYRLYDGRLGAEKVDPDWGRYAVLEEVGKQALLLDRHVGEIAVPRNTPLPSLLAKALTLCSGYAARTVPRSDISSASAGCWDFDLYTDIPLNILETVAAKVGQG